MTPENSAPQAGKPVSEMTPDEALQALADEAQAMGLYDAPKVGMNGCELASGCINPPKCARKAGCIEAAPSAQTTAAAGESLPVVAWRARYISEPGMIGHYPWSFQDREKVWMAPGYEYRPLADHTDAQAANTALQAETERWQAMVWAVARELNCLPSTFSDGNGHVLKAAINLNAELAAIKAAQPAPLDVGAIMALADAYAAAHLRAVLADAENRPTIISPNVAREALRAALARSTREAMK